MSLGSQVQALRLISESEGGFLTVQQLESARSLYARASDRQALMHDYTVVGLLGSTGSGKSSLFNALAGTELSPTGVLRPTTTEVSAAGWGVDQPDELLDWLGVSTYWQSDRADGEPTVVLDLPDFDSIDEANRRKAETLAAKVDVFVWVTDPQKYADRRLHEDFLRPLAHQEAVTVVVLNQADKLPAEDISIVVTSLRDLLKADGVADVSVIVTSAATGAGITELRERINQISGECGVTRTRWKQDIRAWAVQNAPATEPTSKPLQKQAVQLANAAADALGVSQLSETAAAAYRHRGAQRTAWLPLAWIGKFRTDPLRRLGVSGSAHSSTPDARVSTRFASSSPVRDAALAGAVRTYCDQAALTLPATWQTPIWEANQRAEVQVIDSFDKASLDMGLEVGRAAWWGLARVLQWLGIMLSIVGFGWYLANWGAAALKLPSVPIPLVDGWPIPAFLIGGGILFGWVVALLSSVLTALIGRFKKRRVQRMLTERVDRITKAHVVEPIEEVRAHGRQLAEAFAAACG